MRPLAPLSLAVISLVALAACGGDDAADDTAADTTVATATTVPESTTTIDPERCFEVPEAAIPATTAPPASTAAPIGPNVPTSAPATTVPTTVAPTSAPSDTTPGTVTPGVEGEFPAGERPEAIRPCTIPSSLAVTVLRPGTGPAAQAGDTIYIDYAGIRSEDGAGFDDSYGRGEPLSVALGSGAVIAGWDQGLIGAQAGALIRLDIPAELAYGDTPPDPEGVIQAGDALTFLTEVRFVVPATTAADRRLDVTVDTSEGATEITTVDVEVGDGPVLEEGQTAVVHAMLVRGDNRVIFQDTYSTNEPASIPLVSGGSTLPGLVEGLIGATVGSTRVITMPPDDAYGAEGAPTIGLPPDTDVIVVVEVLGVYGTPTSDEG